MVVIVQAGEGLADSAGGLTEEQPARCGGGGEGDFGTGRLGWGRLVGGGVQTREDADGGIDLHRGFGNRFLDELAFENFHAMTHQSLFDGQAELAGWPRLAALSLPGRR